MCRVAGCREPHARHYCRVCGSKDSDHRARHCPSAAGTPPTAASASVSAASTPSPSAATPASVSCHVPGCREPHSRHYCRVCKSTDSDHRARHCPRSGTAQQSPTDDDNDATATTTTPSSSSSSSSSSSMVPQTLPAPPFDAVTPTAPGATAGHVPAPAPAPQDTAPAPPVATTSQYTPFPSASQPAVPAAHPTRTQSVDARVDPDAGAASTSGGRRRRAPRVPHQGFPGCTQRLFMVPCAATAVASTPDRPLPPQKGPFGVAVYFARSHEDAVAASPCSSEGDGAVVVEADVAVGYSWMLFQERPDVTAAHLAANGCHSVVGVGGPLASHAVAHTVFAVHRPAAAVSNIAVSSSLPLAEWPSWAQQVAASLVAQHHSGAPVPSSPPTLRAHGSSDSVFNSADRTLFRSVDSTTSGGGGGGGDGDGGAGGARANGIGDGQPGGPGAVGDGVGHGTRRAEPSPDRDAYQLLDAVMSGLVPPGSAAHSASPDSRPPPLAPSDSYNVLLPLPPAAAAAAPPAASATTAGTAPASSSPALPVGAGPGAGESGVGPTPFPASDKAATAAVVYGLMTDERVAIQVDTDPQPSSVSPPPAGKCVLSAECRAAYAPSDAVAAELQ